jgi:hypothetical protein
MTETELQRVIQYVTGQLSYGLPMTSEVIRIGFGEIVELAKTSTTKLQRDAILAYLCIYTMKKTGYPEPIVREILEAGGRWLDQACEVFAKQEHEARN